MSPPSWATRGRFLFNTDDLPVLRVLEIHRPISYHIDIDDDGAAIADRPDDPSDEVLISLVRDEIILEDVIEPHDFGHGVQKLYDERPRPYHIVCDYTIRFSVRRVNTLQRLVSVR
jgi:hypothetical protein